MLTRKGAVLFDSIAIIYDIHIHLFGIGFIIDAQQGFIIIDAGFISFMIGLASSLSDDL
jgi:hypothetical protein